MNRAKIDKPVVITQYRWAGRLGPFKIKSSCEECDRTTHLLKEMLDKEFKNKGVKLEVKPWLDHFFCCLFRGAWHAPIIMVNGKKFHQFSHKYPMFDQQKLVDSVRKYLGN